MNDAGYDQLWKIGSYLIKTADDDQNRDDAYRIVWRLLCAFDWIRLPLTYRCGPSVACFEARLSRFEAAEAAWPR